MKPELERALKAAVLTAIEGEPKKRGPGRPRGKERSTTKRQTKLRVRAFRERKAEEMEDTRISQEKLLREMRADGLLFFGETAPTVNCVSIQEEVDMARIWARL